MERPYRDRQVNIRLPDEACAILYALAADRRVSQGRMVEQLTREAFGENRRRIAAAKRRYWQNTRAQG